MNFEHLGYFKEYYRDNKCLGTLKSEKDREVIGFEGKITEMVNEELMLDNKKKIKANTEVQTILYPLCGKLIKTYQ